jgi:hypothetical protein
MIWLNCSGWIQLLVGCVLLAIKILCFGQAPRDRPAIRQAIRL